MSNKQYDQHLLREYMLGEIACCDCGFHRNGAHHPKIRCPVTGRCGSCGNNWPCPDHALQSSESVVSSRARRIRRDPEQG